MRADTREFLALLDNLHAHPARECRELFDNDAELWVARAPGRLDVMGGIADYSGSLVLGYRLPKRRSSRCNAMSRGRSELSP
jgi:galactokinase